MELHRVNTCGVHRTLKSTGVLHSTEQHKQYVEWPKRRRRRRPCEGQGRSFLSNRGVMAARPKWKPISVTSHLEPLSTHGFHKRTKDPLTSQTDISRHRISVRIARSIFKINILSCLRMLSIFVILLLLLYFNQPISYVYG